MEFGCGTGQSCHAFLEFNRRIRAHAESRPTSVAFEVVGLDATPEVRPYFIYLWY